MATSDFFGQNQTIYPPGTLMSGQNALLDIDGTIALGTHIEIQYGRELAPVAVISSADMYYTAGPANGRVTVSSLVSKEGFFKNMGVNSGNCGTIEKIVLSLGGTDACASVTSSSAIHIKNAILAGIGIQVRAGSAPISQNVEFKISFLSAT